MITWEISLGDFIPGKKFRYVSRKFYYLIHNRYWTYQWRFFWYLGRRPGFHVKIFDLSWLTLILIWLTYNYLTLICTANQWTGLYMIGTSIMKGLKTLFDMTMWWRWKSVFVIFSYCDVLFNHFMTTIIFPIHSK